MGGGKVEAAAIEKCQSMLSSEIETELVRWNLQKDIGMTCGGEVTLFFQKYGTHSNLQIAIFGAGHVSQSLCQYFAKLDVSVMCFDTRSEWIEKIINAPNIKAVCVTDMAAQIASLDESTFIISMTMGHAHDVPILAKALRRNFPYIGVIGSKSKRNVLEKELIEEGISKEQLQKLICPIGLPFGRNTPEEISISILAQVLSKRDELNF